MTLTPTDKRDALALFILRLGLIWFIALWAIHKLLATSQYQSLAKNIDKIEVSAFQVQAVGSVQLLICALALLGILRPFSYGALALMHAFTISRRWERFFDPFAISERGFPVTRNMVIDLAAMGAFIALILLIHRDHFSLGAWLKRHWEDRWWL